MKGFRIIYNEKNWFSEWQSVLKWTIQEMIELSFALNIIYKNEWYLEYR